MTGETSRVEEDTNAASNLECLPGPSSAAAVVKVTLTKPTAATLLGRLPLEVLTQILSFVPFYDLYGSCQYIDKTWQHIVTRLILGSAVFMGRLLQTNFSAVLDTTYFDFEYNFLREFQYFFLHDSWMGVSLNTSTLSHFPGLARYISFGHYYPYGGQLYLLVKGFCKTSDLPYVVRAQVIDFAWVQAGLYDEDRELLKIPLYPSNPVSLDIVHFHEDSREILLDLADCYRAIAWDYRASQRLKRLVVETQEADFWEPWCKKHSKYWGKKRADVYAEGKLIGLVETIIERTSNLHRGHEDLFYRYDSCRRRILTHEWMTLHSLAIDNSLQFDEHHSSVPQSWVSYPVQYPLQFDVQGNPVRDDNSSVHVLDFRETLDLIVLDFTWMEPENAAVDVMSSEEYEKMLDTWYENHMIKWQRPAT